MTIVKEKILTLLVVQVKNADFETVFDSWPLSVFSPTSVASQPQ